MSSSPGNPAAPDRSRGLEPPTNRRGPAPWTAPTPAPRSRWPTPSERRAGWASPSPGVSTPPSCWRWPPAPSGRAARWRSWASRRASPPTSTGPPAPSPRCIGVPLVEVVTHEGENPAYRANGPDRCFHCKDELFTRISDEVVARYGLTAVAYGENADDIARPDRPGSQAATNHRVLRPLADAGLTKADVRAVARALELPCADKPAAPCLASRIPHFEEVTPEKLRQVEAAESALRDLGFPESRVRHHGDVARIELPVRGPRPGGRRAESRADPGGRCGPRASGSSPWTWPGSSPAPSPSRWSASMAEPGLAGPASADRPRRDGRARPRPGRPARLPRGRLLRVQDRRAGPGDRGRRAGAGDADPVHPGRARARRGGARRAAGRRTRRAGAAGHVAADRARADRRTRRRRRRRHLRPARRPRGAARGDPPRPPRRARHRRRRRRPAPRPGPPGPAAQRRRDRRGRRDGRCPAERRRRAGARARHRGAHLGGLRGGVRGAGRPADHAQLLRPRRRGGQHRQRLRRGHIAAQIAAPR